MEFVYLGEDRLSNPPSDYEDYEDDNDAGGARGQDMEMESLIKSLGEVLTGISFRHVERRQVTRLAVPVAMVVVRHCIDDVQVGVEEGDIIGEVYHSFAGTHCRSEQQSARSEAVTTSEKPSRSVRGPALQSTCQHMGYSQSRSRPLKPHLSRNSRLLSTNLSLLLEIW